MQSLGLPTKVLLIDDDEDDFIRVRNVLTRVSPPRFTLRWVTDSDAAMAEMFLPHDVCLLDYRLGDSSGLELLEKARREGCTLPIIFLTGRGGREVDLLAMKAGADDYIEKEQVSSSLLERSIRYAINRREKEEALKEARDELEARVRERTIELEEANAALRILLKHREDDRMELEENIMYNMKQMIIPYIEKLKGTHLDDRQKMFLALMESNANEITSPFARNLFWKYSNLTPMELQIANLVQEGRTAQQMADILSISESTVKFHKINLRKKLGLTDKKTNLKSFLQSLRKG